MEITEVRHKKIEDEASAVLGIARIVFDGVFVVTGLKVLRGKGGIGVVMPSRLDKDGIRRDICFPITRELRQKIEDAVLKEVYGGSAPPSDTITTKAPDSR